MMLAVQKRSTEQCRQRKRVPMLRRGGMTWRARRKRDKILLFACVISDELSGKFCISWSLWGLRSFLECGETIGQLPKLRNHKSTLAQTQVPAHTCIIIHKHIRIQPAECRQICAHICKQWERYTHRHAPHTHTHIYEERDVLHLHRGRSGPCKPKSWRRSRTVAGAAWTGDRLRIVSQA